MQSLQVITDPRKELEQRSAIIREKSRKLILEIGIQFLIIKQKGLHLKKYNGWREFCEAETDYHDRQADKFCELAAKCLQAFFGQKAGMYTEIEEFAATAIPFNFSDFGNEKLLTLAQLPTKNFKEFFEEGHTFFKDVEFIHQAIMEFSAADLKILFKEVKEERRSFSTPGEQLEFSFKECCKKSDEALDLMVGVINKTKGIALKDIDMIDYHRKEIIRILESYNKKRK